MEQEGGGASVWATPFFLFWGLRTIFDIHHQKNEGAGLKNFLLGIRKYEISGSGGRTGCVPCAVRGREGDGVKGGLTSDIARAL